MRRGETDRAISPVDHHRSAVVTPRAADYHREFLINRWALLAAYLSHWSCERTTTSGKHHFAFTANFQLFHRPFPPPLPFFATIPLSPPSYHSLFSLSLSPYVVSAKFERDCSSLRGEVARLCGRPGRVDDPEVAR